MKKEELYQYAKQENILIKKINFEVDEWEGQCFYDEKLNCIIYLSDNIDDDIYEKCTLAHEIGHFKKCIEKNNILSESYQDTLIRSINEFRANKWAIDKLIPFETFKRFLGTNLSKYEVARELEVTVEFVELACYIYEPLVKGCDIQVV